ncbi:unnamed protein product [Ceutorhynchus assimilis]|uniref:Ionotropic receptor n=1 Tax=Ceutorhynchus assimilis TaxID=467358 RepID=A0A9N9MV47_9CUCU|nr:unnamed protein product [Ceutorhynchus assimilis]
MFSSMILNIYLQGRIISLINGPSYEQPIKSIEELLEKNIAIKLIPTLAFYFGYDNKGLEYYQEIYDRRIESTDWAGETWFESMNKISRDRNIAGTTYQGFLIMRPNLQSTFSTIEFLPYPHPAGMPKNYYMHKEFYEWFNQMIEHGIVTKFLKLYEFSYALQYYVESSSRIYKVTMEQMEPILLMLLSGYLVALFAFILELVIYKVTQFLQQRAI